jgi:hypothetical protein
MSTIHHVIYGLLDIWNVAPIMVYIYGVWDAYGRQGGE